MFCCKQFFVCASDAGVDVTVDRSHVLRFGNRKRLSLTSYTLRSTAGKERYDTVVFDHCIVDREFLAGHCIIHTHIHKKYLVH